MGFPVGACYLYLNPRVIALLSMLEVNELGVRAEFKIEETLEI